MHEPPDSPIESVYCPNCHEWMPCTVNGGCGKCPDCGSKLLDQDQYDEQNIANDESGDFDEYVEDYDDEGDIS